jgi:hypothetical protein
MRVRSAGFTVLEIAAALFILALMAAVFAPLASGLIDTNRSNAELDTLRAIYTAIVGDPKSNTFGYLGDVGDYPSSLIDLVQSPGLPGWNGPYLSNVRIENGILYDQFGGAIEYFQPNPPAVPAVALDQLALISKGRDRSSTNTAANPNQRASFNGTLPSNAGYGSAISNVDNIVYPPFMDNPGTLNYQSHGHVVFNIRHFDESSSVNGIVPGCPGLFNILITSVPRGTNVAYMTYSAGGANVDLIQGLYIVQVFVAGSGRPTVQEQITVRPGTTLVRDYTLSGVNSSLTGTVTLTVVNNSTNPILGILADGTSLSGFVFGNSTANIPISPCSLVQVVNTVSNGNYDYFIMPNFAVTKTYTAGGSPPATDHLQITNSGSNDHLSIYDNGFLVGTVGRLSFWRVKDFLLNDGDAITIKNENNGTVDTFTFSGPITKNY